MPENDTTNESAAPETVSKAEYEAAIKERDGLKESHKALQRSYENLRRGGADLSGITKRLDANEKLQVSILETLGKLGLEGVDTKPILEAHKKDREAAEAVDGVKSAASEAIVAAFEAAGIDQDAFDTTWSTDARFDKARTLFNSGKYTEAAKESIAVLAKPVGKTLTEDEHKKAVEDAVAKDRQTRAAMADSGKLSGATGTFDIEKWRALPVAERLKDLPKAKEWMATHK